MPEIKSPIGNVSISEGQQLPTYKVEDPTTQEAPPRQRLPVEPPVRSSTPQQISVEDYNRYKQQIQESNFTAKSTGDFEIPGERKELSQDDEQFLGFLQGGEPDRGGLQQVRRNVKRKEATISPANKEKVGILLGLGRKTTTVIVEDNEIVLQNLTSKQTQKVLNAVAELSRAIDPGKIQFDQIYVTKHMVIGFALKSINGESVSALLGPDDTDEAREAIVSEMDSDVVNELYNTYIQNIGKTLQLNQDVGEEIKK